MKVDKAVCTTNDIYFNNLSTTDDNINSNDLNSIIKFEQVFTTLVENKILAIKRECEQNESKKKSRTIKSILFGKNSSNNSNSNVIEYTCTTTTANVNAIPGTDKTPEAATDKDDDKTKTKNKSYKQFFVYPSNKKKEIDVEKGEIIKVEVQNDPNQVQSQSTVEPSNNQNVIPATEQQPEAEEDEEYEQPNLDSQLISSKTSKKCDKLIINSNNNNINNSHTDSIDIRHKQDIIIPDHNDESLATTIDISLQQQQQQLPAQQQQPDNLTFQKSDLAIHDDGASSQNTSDIEFSLVSETISTNDIPSSSVKKTTHHSTVLSDPIVKLLSPQSIIKNANKQPTNSNQHHHLARRAISAQSTPIFSRHVIKKPSDGQQEQKKSLKFVESEQVVICDEKTKSKETMIVVAASTNPNAQPTTTVANISSNNNNLPKKQQKHHNKLKDIAIEYEINYDDEAPSPRGFISSFNQLTSNIPPAAVITATRKQSMKQQQSSKTQQDSIKLKQIEEHSKANNDAKMTNELEHDKAIDDVNGKKKRRRRQSSRYSDPVLVYPSSGGLKHCILSRPPNQPIQIEYDADFMYDVSLQIESEFNGEIVPPEHKKHKHKHHHHHRHHHHHDHQNCKKKRHKKRKILVHNLDDQSVKVIDPDDLPERARWTIIATACLLLVMCLFLVGITLRMAPIIDDMVRQENERLLQESLNRAKYAANYTDSPYLSATDQLQSSFVP